MEDYSKYTDGNGLVIGKSKKTDETRTVKIFTYLPLWLNKFSWLQHIEVIERKYIVSERWFDDGNTYEFYWTPPKEEWEIESIV